MERPGKWSPAGKRYYSTSPFWKTRWEMSPMYSLASRSGYRTYPEENRSREDLNDTQEECTLHARDKKPRIPYLPKSLRRIRSPANPPTPSPASYSITSLMGTGPGVSIQTRHVDAGLFRSSVAHPGPADYTTASLLGNHRPRYSMGGRTVLKEVSSKNPGPSDYNIKTIFDRYNISPTSYVPVFMRIKSE